MRTRLLSWLVCLPLWLSAQTKEWAPIGAKWYYNWQELDFYELHSYIEYIVVKDTIVQNLPAKFVLKKAVNYNGNIENETSLLIREDNQKVFWFNQNNNSFSLIYDFSLEKGDTLMTPIEIVGCDSVSPIIVDSVTFIKVGNTILKKQYLSYTAYNSHFIGRDYTFTYELIEKIGSEFDFLYIPSTLIEDRFAYSGLRCYIDQEITYHTLWWLERFGTASCDTIINTSIIKHSLPVEIKVFPNPFESFVTIVSQQPLNQIDLYSVMGHKINSYPCYKQCKITLNLSAYNSGIYFLQIYSNTINFKLKILKK
ncbi:MAG: T9SS type A sorting domain-containing protein [Bacteroidales bacterium]|nr:T9SS type A sorting domain-containing protein [Bacteroidales bacterium]